MTCNHNKHFDEIMVKFSNSLTRERIEFSKTNQKGVELQSFLSSQSKTVQGNHQNRQNTEGMEQELSHKTWVTWIRRNFVTQQFKTKIYSLQNIKLEELSRLLYKSNLCVSSMSQQLDNNVKKQHFDSSVKD